MPRALKTSARRARSRIEPSSISTLSKISLTSDSSRWRENSTGRWPSRTNLRLASAPMTPMPPVIRTRMVPSLFFAALAERRHEQLVDWNRLRDQTLLDHIRHQRFQCRPIRLDAIWPAIAAEQFVNLLHVVRQPRQHVTQRPGIAHLFSRPVLRFVERVIETRREERILLIDIVADDDEMHDRKDLCAPDIVLLLRAIVGNKPHHVGIAAERLRHVRADDGVDFA